MKSITTFKVPRKKIRELLLDGKKSAKVIDLVYVTGTEPGIQRVKKGKGFVYLLNNKKVNNKKDLQRIRHLVIPPAWQEVWICSKANGHLQATGYDTRNRKQYRYHSLWSEFRNQTKFFQLLEFGKKLPAIREHLAKDLAKTGLPVEKVLAAVITIMQHTSIRVGSSMYEKLYGSFGLTTLKDDHVKINGSNVKFSFKGKKGVYHQISLKSRKLANIIKQCRDIPGKELFQYYDENGERKSIDSGMVNAYLKNICDGNFTTKDFRTWTGTVHAIEAFIELGKAETITEAKRKVVEALDIVAARLGNTRAVCKKYYVHPSILEMYTEGKLNKYLHRTAAKGGLSPAEATVMKILAA